MNPSDDRPTSAAIPADGPTPVPQRSVPQIDSRQLMQGAREILIYHNGEPYRLSITRNDKLILHK